MRLHHFFIEQKIGDREPAQQGSQITVPDPSLIHQLRNVFRLREGDQVVLLDNSGFQYVASIVSLDKDGGVFHIEGREQNQNIPAIKVVLYQSLIKKDNFEWVSEKATELGVSSIVPVLAERSEKKALYVERCEAILKEASEQSGRGTLPELHEVMKLSDVVVSSDGITSDKISLIAFDPDGDKFDREELRRQFSGNEGNDGKEKTEQKKAFGVLIGPEGGWSDVELKLMRDKGVKIFSLGKQVLRAETAAISVLSLLLL